MNDPKQRPDSPLALVTGATRGLGRAIATALGHNGYRVIANHHHHAELDASLASEIGCPVMTWDVGDFNACQQAISEIESVHGPVDVLVNNAGITADSALHKMSPAQWASVLATNLGSVFNLCRLVIPGMRDRQYGRVINISSVNGQKGQFGQANYAAAKAGMLGFTRSLALENARKGITVNAIAPGYCDTDMVADVPEKILTSIIGQIPVGRLGNPAEIARTVCFLASRESGFITGETIAVNGGQYMS